MKNINYGKQSIDENDIKNIQKVLKNDFLATGPKVKEFENNIKKYLNSKYAIVCNSGTSAIHLALLSLQLGKNSTVIMPCINFISAFNLCKIMNFKIFLTDVDMNTGQMTPELLIECIKKNNLKKIDVLITMQLGGYPENTKKFFDLKKKFKFKIIEDACHSFGAKYKVKDKIYNVGSCKHADLSTFSFHPLKSITTGEGGAVTTNNSTYAKRISLIRSHGIQRKKNHWQYEVRFCGFNYRLSDINCTLGISQLKKIKKFLKKRKDIYFTYIKKLNRASPYIVFPNYNNIEYSSFHLILININFEKIRSSKNKFFKFMQKNNIFLQYHYIPIYKFAVGKNLTKSFKNAEKYYKNTVSLPVHYSLSKNDQQKVINNILNFIKI